VTESSTLRRLVLQIARRILCHPTAPHHEDLIAGAIHGELEKIARIQTDRFGNMIARVGRNGGKPIAFCAHMDHPGFVIKTIRGKNLQAVFLGWVQRPFFKRGVGVDLFDAGGGRTGRARVVGPGRWKRQKPVRLKLIEGKPGPFGMWALPAIKIKGSKLHSRACDDLIGCAAIVAALKALSKRGKSGIGIFTRREETGLCGAIDLARSKQLPKDWRVISVETSSERCNALQGDGPIVRVGDRSAIFEPELTAELCAKAKVKSGLRWQRKLMDGGTCEATAFLKYGYRAGGLCIALGNYHNCGSGERIQAENVDVNDLVGLVRLMIAVAT
jgi:putative aminopeptidase FrvX